MIILRMNRAPHLRAYANGGMDGTENLRPEAEHFEETEREEGKARGWRDEGSTREDGNVREAIIKTRGGSKE